MAGTIRDPELLGENCWTVNRKLLSGVVVYGSGLHLRRIVTIAELSEAETAHVLKAVHLSHDRQVAFRVEARQRAAKKIELDCELGDEGAVDLTKHLMGCENVMGISLKVKNRHNFLIADSLDSIVS